MPKFSRDFGSPERIEREVEFKLNGKVFHCVGDITAGILENYLGAIRDSDQRNEDGDVLSFVPYVDQLALIDACLIDDESREAFRAMRHDRKVFVSTDTVNEIKDYLIETYSERNPTNEPLPGSSGSSESGTTSQESVGQPDSIPADSPLPVS